MADGDRLAMALEEIRRDLGLASHMSALHVGTQGDRLLRAVDAVLRLADGARVAGWGGAPCSGSCNEGPCDCTGPRPLAWSLDPQAVRDAITEALTACRHCGQLIARCEHPGTGTGAECKGWHHPGYRQRDPAGHHCWGLESHPAAEPKLASEENPYA